jgi:hypothetical protein
LTFSLFNYKIRQLKVVSLMDQCLCGGMNGFNSFSRIIYTHFANSDAIAPQYSRAPIWESKNGVDDQLHVYDVLGIWIWLGILEEFRVCESRLLYLHLFWIWICHHRYGNHRIFSTLK